jgi:hypothetical protein
LDRFHIYLIKPTRYDDEGYPLQWWRSIIPSNSLACLAGIVEDALGRGVLAGLDVQLEVIDEIHSKVSPARIIRDFRQGGGRGFIGLVGVQTNQFPRGDGPRTRVPRCRSAGLHRRVPRLGLHLDAQGNAC